MSLLRRQDVRDYRNCKMQQVFKGSQLDFTLLLDSKYLFALGRTDTKNVFQGPVLILYPHQSLFFGHLSKQKTDRLCIFQTDQQYKIYFHATSKKYLIQIKQSRIILHIEYKNHLQNQQITIVDSFSYKCQQQRMKYLKSHFPTETIFDLKHFLTQYYKNAFEVPFIAHEQGRIIAANSVSGMTVTFKPNSTSVSYQDKNQNEFWRHKEKDLLHEQITIGKQIYAFQYNICNRPHQAQVLLQKHFTTSMAFVDKFIPLNYLYKLQHQFNDLIHSMLFVELPLAQKEQFKKDYCTPIHVVKEDIYKALKQKKYHRQQNLSSLSHHRQKQFQYLLHSPKKQNYQDNYTNQRPKTIKNYLPLHEMQRSSRLRSVFNYQQKKDYYNLRMPQTALNQSKKQQRSQPISYRKQKQMTNKQSAYKQSQTNKELFKQLQMLQQRSHSKGKNTIKKVFQIHPQPSPQIKKQFYQQIKDLKQLTACYETIMNKLQKPKKQTINNQKNNRPLTPQKGVKQRAERKQTQSRKPFAI